MSEKKYYCFCSSNCKYETMTKEQILAAISQAIATGKVGDCDTGFVTKLKEINSGRYVTFWVGTQEQYNALDNIDNNCMYIITDDTTTADLLKTVEDMKQSTTEAAAAAGESAEKTKRLTEIYYQNVDTLMALMQPVDISAEFTISLKSAPSSLTSVSCEQSYAVYAPAVGAVFFYAWITYKGSITEGSNFSLSYGGDYRAKYEQPITCTTDSFSGGIAGNEILIYANELMEAPWSRSIMISGWFFCNKR